MLVWLDDERPMPPEYTNHVRTAAEAIELLKTGEVQTISLDHDLGGAWNGTGYDVAKFIEQEAVAGRLKRIRVYMHTQNPVGKENMRKALCNAHRAWMVENRP